MENTKESFVMYGSFLSAAEKALSLEDIARFVLFLRDYALKGEDVHSENPMIEALLEMAKPNLKAAKKRYDDACKGREHGWKGAEHGIKGGRPRKGETKEEYDERKRKERELKESEEVLGPAGNPKTAVETLQNPKNPLNDNVNVNVNEKENDYEKDNVEGNDYVKEEDNGYSNVKEKEYVEEKGNENDKNNVYDGDNFFNSLIINDFEDEDTDYSCREGSISALIEGKYWEEAERLYRQSHPLEEDDTPYI